MATETEGPGPPCPAISYYSYLLNTGVAEETGARGMALMMHLFYLRWTTGNKTAVITFTEIQKLFGIDRRVTKVLLDKMTELRLLSYKRKYGSKSPLSIRLRKPPAKVINEFSSLYHPWSDGVFTQSIDINVDRLPPVSTKMSILEEGVSTKMSKHEKLEELTKSILPAKWEEPLPKSDKMADEKTESGF